LKIKSTSNWPYNAFTVHTEYKAGICPGTQLYRRWER
jgi:hypothetical protein